MVNLNTPLLDERRTDTSIGHHYVGLRYYHMMSVPR